MPAPQPRPFDGPAQRSAAFLSVPSPPEAEVVLPQPTVADAIVQEVPTRAGASPVLVEAPRRPVPAAQRPTAVRVEVLDQATVDRLGGQVLGFRLSRRDPAGAAGEVALSIDFAGFAEAYGADWAGRARLIAVPECALTTPEVPACQERREVPSRYEPTAKRLAVDAVPAATATDASGGPVPGGSPEPEPGPEPMPSPSSTTTSAALGPNTTTTVATTTSASTATSDAEPSPTTTATTEAASSGGQAGTRPSSDVPGTSAPGATMVPPSGPAALPPGDSADTDGETDPGVDEPLAPAQAGGVVYVLSSGPNSLQGDFRATPFSPSGSWVTDLSSGGFSWSYTVPAPPPPAGPRPDLTLRYASQSIDGMNASSSSQAGWAGLGWSISEAFIERRYVTCPTTGDRCWPLEGGAPQEELHLSMSGGSGRLVKIGPDEWRLQRDPSWRVRRLHLAPPTKPTAYPTYCR